MENSLMNHGIMITDNGINHVHTSATYCIGEDLPLNATYAGRKDEPIGADSRWNHANGGTVLLSTVLSVFGPIHWLC